MVIGIANLPADVTVEEIAHLLHDVEIASVKFYGGLSGASFDAWVTLALDDRNWAHSLADDLHGRVYRGHVLAAQEMLFFSH